MVKLVCIDVDGTLVGSSGTVLPQVWEAAKRAREAGIRLAVCSGRPAFGLARQYAERLDGSGWHVFQNGASVVNAASGESRSRELPERAVAHLVARSRETGRVLELYTDGEYAVESTGDRAERHAGLLGVPFQPRPFDALARPIVRAQWLVALEDADAILAEPHVDYNIALSTSPVMPDTGFLNITPPHVDKSTAVAIVARTYGLTMEDVMMVGDGLNDVQVMRSVGFPVAMANADPEVHAVARRTVGHVDDAGLAEALDLAVKLAA